ncbi:UDP-N-acetylenolpyruvoylglucosamine reductase [Lonsdalea populi]|uniref:UDP-N-acetylenolpyruvoylglucosamine reductase n=3 Tax=Pectobacteriaceae TaxID=1903410 RepID=A0ACD1JAC9_9GAMM|nr:UDP-N-acetylmuramate dehydrogenase [Lonsdalea populi]RAT10024.1 UDP-N-acetylenolpyruvoylglucosamine reductase [Lonsdalea quercina]OSM93949.1 UDP-N-acetylenolpyruvoylglucosamine reductase [Lonsdalea populi]QPQ24060.1 UDP-N-acetylmuramate dehydrogenase [Lonsdalea populi]RAT12264.1 UDP-N-acetylenolpyruvoylglucosamine reductase [Lonsdalea quercina]RAT16339.1 UDP-N-acetylenolpyruvoylglucosamine reductase [Lonsdalea populi]
MKTTMTSAAASLQPYNSFSLTVLAKEVITAKSAEDLLSAWKNATISKQPVLILGGGSNVLFLEDFNGCVVLNRLRGIEIKETDASWHLHVGAGEVWHDLVEFTLNRNIPGLENLALIPGCVGSAPIQNIGAYGVELKDVCVYVDVLNLNTGEQTRLVHESCQFGYRESVFKHQYRDGYAITAVGLTLPKLWQPVLDYGDLTRCDPQTVTPQDVFNSVCAMRKSKLPDPAVNGNAGSFFKNPVLPAALANELLRRFPLVPHYPQANGEVKFAAGWLIDQCELKGHRIGDAAVHANQALVLVNVGHATSAEVVSLARYVRHQVAEKFGVWLEPEVRFITRQGEVNAVEVLA